MKNANNLCDIFLDKLKYITITGSLILLMFLWSIIPTIILKMLNINIDSLPQTIKVLFSFIFDIAFLIFLIYIYRKELNLELKKFFNQKNCFKNIKTSLFYWSIGLAIMITFNLIISSITPSLSANETAVREMIDKFPMYMAFQVMIYAPISEEIIFRKSIDRIFKNKYLYVLASGLIFGGLHVIYSITSPIDLLYLLPYCSLGFTFALLYKDTNNIFSTITAHSIHNTLAFLLYLIY